MKESMAKHIVQVGVELFSTKGFGNVGLLEILKTAGVPKGSFYHYFKNKEGFSLKVVEFYSESSLEVMMSYLADESRNGKDRIMHFYKDMLSVYTTKEYTEGCLLGNCSVEMSGINPLYAKKISDEFTKWEAELATCIQLGKEDGSILNPKEASKLAAYILNSWEGALLRMKSDKSDEAMRIFIEMIEEML